MLLSQCNASRRLAADVGSGVGARLAAKPALAKAALFQCMYTLVWLVSHFVSFQCGSGFLSLPFSHLGTHTHNQNPVEQCSSATTQQLATGLIPKIYLAKTVSESPKKREKPKRNGDTIAIGFETVRYHKPYNKGRHRLLLRHF